MTRALVLPLSNVARDDLPIAGGKGANLGELIQGGFDVPDGFVVTTVAYDEFVGDLEVPGDLAALDTAERDAAFATGRLPDGLAEAVGLAYERLASPPVAVRSSATAEDLPDASFAGQQETYLNVRGIDAVLDAIRRCWASLWTERAVTYRDRHADGGHVSIAVVVQQLVDAEVAGVMFTANPVNGRRDETVITAAWGLGEAVVSGHTEPDEYVITPDSVNTTVAAKAVMTVTTTEGVDEVATEAGQRAARTLTDAEARELADLGRHVAEHFGAPQDIEWGRDSGGFRVLQARPITALPDHPTGPIPTDWPIPRKGSMYFRASIVEQLPDPLSPLFADMIATAVPAGLRSLLSELGSQRIPTDIQFPTINGYAFYDYSYGTLTAWSLLAPMLLRLMGKPGFIRNRWADQELPKYRDTVAAWRDRDAADLSADDLVTGAQAMVDAACLYYTTVQSIIPIASMSELTWMGLYDRALKRADDPPASDYVVGYDSEPILAEKSLYTLAQWCRTQPGLSEALRAGADPNGPTPDGVEATVWAEFTERFTAHLAAHGYMLYNLDLINPVPADDPTPVLLGLRHDLTDDATDPYERQAEQAAHRDMITADLLARLDPVRARLARRSLDATRTWGPVREDALAAMGLGWPTARRLLREFGTRLVAAGVIAEVDDVYWITLPEARAAADSLNSAASVEPLADQVDQRKVIHRGEALATPPQALPKSASTRWLDAFMPSREQASGPTLVGTSGTGGAVTGVARVLRSPADFGDFQPGEILVGSITTPAYTPLFAQAAGVVTDIGGVLSHGSIVAREYGIPAVLGTGVATSRINTGDVITVDGPQATVHLTDDDTPEPTAGKARPTRWIVAGVAVAGGLLLWRYLRGRRPRIGCQPIPTGRPR